MNITYDNYTVKKVEILNINNKYVYDNNGEINELNDLYNSIRENSDIEIETIPTTDKSYIEIMKRNEYCKINKFIAVLIPDCIIDCNESNNYTLTLKNETYKYIIHLN